jgi:Putative beta-barrel porin 2
MTIPVQWLVSRGPALACGRLLCALALLTVAGVAVQAQESGDPGAVRAQGPGVPGPQVFYSSIGSLEATLERYRADPRPQSSEGAFQLADWLLYGGMGWGAACDYNLNSTPTNQEQACGPRFTPSIVAERNTGIQRTLLYGVGDVRYYPTLGRVDLVDTTAGLVHVWEIQRDLIFRVQAQGTRGQEYSGFSANLLPTGAFLTTPVNFTRGYGSTSIQKEFGNFFTAIGGSYTHTVYEDAQDNLGNTIDEEFRNGNVTTANGRIGYHISPIIYTYVEPTYNWQRYAASNLNSEGYRVVAGLGSGRIGLFNGEIYAGYATQQFENPLVGTTSIPVFGGKLSWFPTRFLTYTFTADRTFATSDFNANGLVPGSITNTGPGLLPGSSTIATTATLTGIWDFSRRFAFNGSVSNQRLEYLNSSRQDDLLTLVGGVTFKIRPGLGIQVNYIHQNLFTNFPGAEYTRDFISVGAQSRF